MPPYPNPDEIGSGVASKQSKISGGIVVSPRKNDEGVRMTKSRLTSINKNVYRQLWINPTSPNQRTVALTNRKLSRTKRQLGNSQEPLYALQRASRVSKMDSSKLNQDIVLTTGNSFMKVIDNDLPATGSGLAPLQPPSGLITAKYSREGGASNFMQLSEKDEIDTPGVLFPVLSSQSTNAFRALNRI